MEITCTPKLPARLAGLPFMAVGVFLIWKAVTLFLVSTGDAGVWVECVLLLLMGGVFFFTGGSLVVRVRRIYLHPGDYVILDAQGFALWKSSKQYDAREVRRVVRDTHRLQVRGKGRSHGVGSGSLLLMGDGEHVLIRVPVDLRDQDAARLGKRLADMFRVPYEEAGVSKNEMPV